MFAKLIKVPVPISAWSRAHRRHFGVGPGDSCSTLSPATDLFCALRNFLFLSLVFLSWQYKGLGHTHFLNRDQVRKKGKLLKLYFLTYLSLLGGIFQCNECCLGCCPSTLWAPQQWSRWHMWLCLGNQGTWPNHVLLPGTGEADPKVGLSCSGAGVHGRWHSDWKVANSFSDGHRILVSALSEAGLL